MRFQPLHHGESDGFDAATLLIVVGVLLGVAAVAFGIWWLMRRRYA